MTSTSAPRWYVAVFADDSKARAAAQRLQSSGVAEARVGNSLDALASIRGEMQEEINHVPAPPVPFTREAVRGFSVGALIGVVVGLVCALPFAAIHFGDIGTAGRVLIVGVVGVVFGGFLGWFLGGAFGIKRPDEPAAAAVGTTIAVPASPAAREALLAAGAQRVDLIGPDGQPIATAMSDDPGPTAIFRDLARHAREEKRPD